MKTSTLIVLGAIGAVIVWQWPQIKLLLLLRKVASGSATVSTGDADSSGTDDETVDTTIDYGE